MAEQVTSCESSNVVAQEIQVGVKLLVPALQVVLYALRRFNAWRERRWDRLLKDKLEEMLLRIDLGDDMQSIVEDALAWCRARGFKPHTIPFESATTATTVRA